MMTQFTRTCVPLYVNVLAMEELGDLTRFRRFGPLTASMRVLRAKEKTHHNYPYLCRQQCATDGLALLDASSSAVIQWWTRSGFVFKYYLCTYNIISFRLTNGSSWRTVDILRQKIHTRIFLKYLIFLVGLSRNSFKLAEIFNIYESCPSYQILTVD